MSTSKRIDTRAYHAQALWRLNVEPGAPERSPGGTLKDARLWAWGLALATLCTTAAHACAVCYGAEGDPQTAGMNGAILTLLGVTGLVALGVAGLALRLMRRAGQASPASSPAAYVEPADTMACCAGLEAATNMVAGGVER